MPSSVSRSYVSLLILCTNTNQTRVIPSVERQYFFFNVLGVALETVTQRGGRSSDVSAGNGFLTRRPSSHGRDMAQWIQYVALRQSEMAWTERLQWNIPLHRPMLRFCPKLYVDSLFTLGVINFQKVFKE